MPDTKKDEGGEVVTLISPAAVQKAIKAAVKKVTPLRAANRENNAEVTAIKADLEAQGITRRAFERSFQDAETIEAEGGADKLRAQRTAEDLCQEAMGVAQGNLFAEAAE